MEAITQSEPWFRTFKNFSANASAFAGLNPGSFSGAGMALLLKILSGCFNFLEPDPITATILPGREIRAFLPDDRALGIVSFPKKIPI
jgi:hypothetical protein